MEIAIGEAGEAFCHDCEEAGCEADDGECLSPRAYGGDEPEEELPVCPLDGNYGEPLGALGKLMHYRCRACGMNFSRAKE